MNTEQHHITIRGLRVEIVRKGIKNLHLGVYPPNGRVRVAAPLRVSNEAVRLAVIGKLGWIKRQRARFEAQPRASRRQMVDGETHYFLGRRYRLRVIQHAGAGRVVVRNNSRLEIHARQELSTGQRERILQRWYREQLKALIPPLLAQWQQKLGVKVAAWGIKKMKTRWGTCQPEAARIWLNLELAMKPARYLEYVIVHETIHLLDRTHGEKFIEMMARHLPNWKNLRAKLNALPLPHDEWRC